MEPGPMMSVHDFAVNWHRLLFEGHMPETWRLMTDDFRRVVAQSALSQRHAAGQEVDWIVEELAVPEPTHDDVGEFWDAARAILQRSCGFPPDQVGAGQTARFEAPAYETVRLWVLEDLAVDLDTGELYLPDKASARAIGLIASFEEPGTWRIAGLEAVMVPGWPPTVLWEPPPQV